MLISGCTGNLPLSIFKLLFSNYYYKHSQRISAGLLLPWVIAKQKGEVLAIPCTCMAG